jgi:hypothetical protein
VSLRFSKNKNLENPRLMKGSPLRRRSPSVFTVTNQGIELECTAKLDCDICGSTDHLTCKCPILKQPRLLAHPCGYDVSGLGFYHIPHAPINFKKSNNRTALVTVQGGEF